MARLAFAKNELARGNITADCRRCDFRRCLTDSLRRRSRRCSGHVLMRHRRYFGGRLRRALCRFRSGWCAGAWRRRICRYWPAGGIAILT